MPDVLTFNELQESLIQCFQEGKYTEALDLATAHLDRLPDYRADLNYWRMCAAARLEKHELAIKILEETLGGGDWYSEPVLRRSPSLQPLNGIPEYERLIERSVALWAAEQEKDHGLIVVEPEGQNKPYPLLVALHSNMARPSAARDSWIGLSDRGWLLAFPQSRLAMWKGAYAWDDRDTVVPGVVEDLKTICERYPVDLERVVLAGHSMGGQLATWLALSQAIKARGFIVVGPYLPEEEISQWDEIIRGVKGSGLRGVFIFGDADDSIPHDMIYALCDKLKAQGLDCRVEKHSGLGHDFVPEIKQSLPAALDYVMQE